MNLIKEKTVSFSGYRPKKLLLSNPHPDLHQIIFEETCLQLRKLCEEGYNTFLSGMAQGFDMLAAEAVLKVKLDYPEIKLIAVIPYQGQELSYNKIDQERYRSIYQKCADSIFISDTFYFGAYHERNDFLVDYCSVLLVYYDGQRGGTQYTFQEGQKNRKTIINIHDFTNSQIEIDEIEF